MTSTGRGVVGSVLALLLFSMMDLAPQAAKPASSKPCSLVFQDRVGDKVTSDNRGSYKDAALPGGDSTVSCQAGGDNDSIKLILSAPKKGTPGSFRGA